MNEQATKLIEQLAQKLGTTSEYLWGILLKQATIDATITLIQCILIWLGVIVFYKFHKYFSKKEDRTYSIYDRNETICATMVIASFIMGVMLIISFFSINSIISGYFNPEYWALNEILKSLN